MDTIHKALHWPQTTKAWGLLVTAFYLAQSSTRNKLKEISLEVLKGTEHAPKKRIFVMMLGYSLSGKTWFIDHHPNISRFFRVETRKIHDLLNAAFPLLDDDKTIEGVGYQPRQILTQVVRRWVLREACQKGVSLVSDSCNLSYGARQRRLRLPKRLGYKTFIVWVLCKKGSLGSRLREKDEELLAQGQNPVWVDLHEKQKARFDPPTLDEADETLIAQSEVHDPEEIVL